jgi:hypothetical protein
MEIVKKTPNRECLYCPASTALNLKLPAPQVGKRHGYKSLSLFSVSDIMAHRRTPPESGVAFLENCGSFLLADLREPHHPRWRWRLVISWHQSLFD